MFQLRHSPSFTHHIKTYVCHRTQIMIWPQRLHISLISYPSGAAPLLQAKKPVLGMKKFSFPQIVTVNVSNERTVQKLNTANHRDHWLTSGHYESRGELFHMWWGITEVSNVSTPWIHNVQLNRKPCKPVPAWPFLLAVCKVHTDICCKNIGSASTYFNVGLYMLLQNTVADSNYPKSYWNSSHHHLLVHYRSVFKLTGLVFMHRQNNTASLWKFQYFLHHIK